jgi:hypothetical protein
MANKSIRNILVVPKATYRKSIPADMLNVVFMDYDKSIAYSPKNSKWSKGKQAPSEWNVTHKAKGNRASRRMMNMFDALNQYPSLFEAHTALGAGGVRQIGNTLVLSGQTPNDVIDAYLTGEIPTKMGRNYIK